VGVILDIILSLALRGAIVIAVLNMTVSLQGKLSEKTAQANELNLVNTVSAIMRYDLDKVGYNWTGGPPYFSVASADTIEFVYSSTQPPNFPSPWRVKFFLGNTLDLINTANPNDRVLYKKINGGGSISVANGVVQLKFQYFDATGSSTAILSNIKSFSVDLVMASGDAVNGLYPASEWYYRFFPSNIN
jgi:hypothetical protein